MHPFYLTEVEKTPGNYPSGAAAFLRAIVADPADDTARLAFADWLQEHGDEPRAELIRTQLELHHRGIDCGAPCDVQALGAEDRALFQSQARTLESHRKPWLDDFPVWATDTLRHSFRRGFPTAIRAGTSQWLKWHEWMRRWVPLEEVNLDASPDHPDLLASPTLLGLKRLTLWGVREGDLHALAGSDAVTTLNALNVRGRLPRPNHAAPDTVTPHALFGSAKLASLRELQVQFDRAGDTLGFLIAGSPYLRNLRTLSLSHGMGADAARALFDSPNLANVTHLELSDNPFGDAGMRALVRSPYLTQLTTLDLTATNLTAASGRLLAEWPGLRTINTLKLAVNALGLDGVTALSESPHLERMRGIQLHGNVADSEAEAVRRLPGFAHLFLFVETNRD